MLRSYEYSETADLKWNNKAPELFRKELDTAEKTVRNILRGTVKEVRRECPVCGHYAGRMLYQKWGAPYRICKSCGSIYCQCNSEQVNSYKDDSCMRELRLSEAYQSDAADRRSMNWMETVRWLQFRLYRYLNKKDRLSIVDIGNRYYEFANIIKNAEFCGAYELKDSILPGDSGGKIEKADVILYLNGLQQVINPLEKLLEFKENLDEDGILILSTRAGSGFDILTLLDRDEHIYPFEHITLLSVKGLLDLLKRSGYQTLEVTTPGNMDVNYVYANRDRIQDDNLFIKMMMTGKNGNTLHEFQRFLQKNCMSSYVQIIAKREK